MQPEEIRALCAPDLPLEQTVSLVKELMKANRYLDVQMAELLLGRSSARAVNQATALRILEILDQVTVGSRLVRTVSQLLEHDDPHIRSKAALVVGRHVGGWAWIEARLETAECRVRASMLEALWESQDARRASIFAHYRDDSDNRVVGNALYGLYLAHEPNVIPRILRMASHANPKFRGTAAWLMGKIGQLEFVDVLRGLLHDEDRRVKGMALKSLVRINRAGSAGGAAIPDN